MTYHNIDFLAHLGTHALTYIHITMVFRALAFHNRCDPDPSGYVYHQACTILGGPENLKDSIARGDTFIGKSENKKNTLYFIPTAAFGKGVECDATTEAERQKKITDEGFAAMSDIFEEFGYGLADGDGGKDLSEGGHGKL